MRDLPSSGTVEAIYVTSSAGEAMRSIGEAEAIAGQGLTGDRYLTGRGYYSGQPSPGGGRQLTLIEAEALETIEEETGIHLAPAESRRNLLTRGIHLDDLVGERFYVGEVFCEGVRPCDPCKYLQDLTGKQVLKPLVARGGLRANILTGGTIAAGDRLLSPREYAPDDAPKEIPKEPRRFVL